MITLANKKIFFLSQELLMVFLR